jgi:hypothetical protein
MVGMGWALVRSGVFIDLYTLIIFGNYAQNLSICTLFTSFLGYNLLLFGIYHSQGIF